MLRIVLTATDPRLAGAWRRHCARLDAVELHEGSILEADCDAVVSPANSFGTMQGGIDALYCRTFGWHLQDQLQDVIAEHHGGELVVGLAEILETGSPVTPFVIAAPTMRVPMILDDGNNAYLAASAVLRLVLEGTFRRGAHAGRAVRERVRRVAFPGLGTGTGGLDPDECAAQVAEAIAACLEAAAASTHRKGRP